LGSEILIIKIKSEFLKVAGRPSDPGIVTMEKSYLKCEFIGLGSEIHF
jgi:hypothetical protein